MGNTFFSAVFSQKHNKVFKKTLLFFLILFDSIFFENNKKKTYISYYLTLLFLYLS